MSKGMEGLILNLEGIWSKECESTINGRTEAIPSLKGKSSVKSLSEQSFNVTGPRLFNCKQKSRRNIPNSAVDWMLLG